MCVCVCVHKRTSVHARTHIHTGADVVWGGGGGSGKSQQRLLDCLARAAARNQALLVLISFCPRYKSEAVFWREARRVFDVSRWRQRVTGQVGQETGGIGKIWVCRLAPLSGSNRREELRRRGEEGERGGEWGGVGERITMI